MVGTQISVYKITHLLGEGGMGTVYEAVHEQLGKRVAIKILNPEMARNTEGLTRFFNEARAVNLIEHPGLVQIFEFGQLPNGSAYLVMEHLHGETLSDRLKRSPQLPEPEALYLCYQLAAILAAAHERGIVHRDLKPSELRAGLSRGGGRRDGRVRTDCGLVRRALRLLAGRRARLRRGALAGQGASVESAL